MLGSRLCQRFKGVAAFEYGYDFARAARCRLNDFVCQPGKIRLVQVKPARFVQTVCVESCRQQHQFGFECGKPGQPLSADGFAECAAARSRRQGQVHHIAAVGHIVVFGEGEKVGFKQVEKQDARIVFEYFCRTVAVVYIKIDDGDAVQPVFGKGVHRTGGNVVQQAESAGFAAARMVSGRAGGAKGMPCFTVHDHVDCLNCRTCGKTGGRQGVFADNGVVVQAANLAVFGQAGL